MEQLAFECQFQGNEHSPENALIQICTFVSKWTLAQEFIQIKDEEEEVLYMYENKKRVLFKF